MHDSVDHMYAEGNMNIYTRYALMAHLVAGVLLISCGSKKTENDSAKPNAPQSFSKSADKPAADREYLIAWSVWTGWMPFKLMEAKGFLAKRAAERGLKVKLVEFPVYMDSVTAFAAGKLDACAITAMEALQPAAAGIDTVAIVVN